MSELAPIKFIGLGGVGGIAARYLVMYLAALGRPARVVLVDGDAFEPRNAERMFFSSCGNKAAVVRDELLDALGGSRVTLTAVEQYVTPENLTRLVRDGDRVLLAVDNHATRKLVDDHCGRLANVTLISGGNDGVGADGAGRVQRGTWGNVQIHLRRDGREERPALARFHPEIADPRDQAPQEASCTAALETTPQLLFTNLATASAMLNAFRLEALGELHYPELCFDIHDGLMRPLSAR